MAKKSVVMIPRASIERAGIGEKSPMELRRNRITSSWVNQQNSRPLWTVMVVELVEGFGYCFLLELNLVWIGTTRF